MVEKNLGGRPVKYKNPEDMQVKIDEYFEKTKETRITITGLCLHLGFTKETFYEYAKKPEFKPILDRARLMVENSYEISLRENGRTGDIFALKNFGWRDKQPDEEEKDIKNGIIVDLLGALKDAKKD